MKYPVFLLAVITILIMALPMAAVAGDDCQKGDGCEGDCPEMGTGECDNCDGSCETGPGRCETEYTCESECEIECDSPCEMEMECMEMEPGRMPMMMHMRDGMGPHGMPFEGPWHHGMMMGGMMQHMDDQHMNMEAMHYMNGVRTVLVLPFVDATRPTYEGEPMLADAGGPMRIVDNLVGALQERGYMVIPPRDAELAWMDYNFDEVRSLHANDEVPPEMQNNNFYFENMPDRSMDFYQSMVPGLQEQEIELLGVGTSFVTPEDIIILAAMFDADVVIRGFVHEFAVTDDVDADWRTFIPPFLGLWNPDRRATMEVSYYMYCGHEGNMIWNTTIESQKNADWPLFNGEDELLRAVEHEVVWEATDMFLPNWMDVVCEHPQWVPFEMWEGGCDSHMMMDVYRPDWLNPYRDGWHDEYLQGEWDLHLNEDSGEKYEEDLHIWHNYNLYRDYLEKKK